MVAFSWAEPPLTGHQAVKRATGRQDASAFSEAPDRRRVKGVRITDEKRSNTVSEENFERFTKCAVEVLSVDAARVTKEASFAEDLDADSLDLVELIMSLEEEFGVTVEEEELEDITTIGGAYDLVVGKLK